MDTFSSPHPAAHCPFSGALFHLSPSDNALYLYLNDTAGDSGKSVPALEEESDFSSFKDEPAVIYGGEKELQQFGVFCVDLQKLKKNHKKNCHKGLLLKKVSEYLHTFKEVNYFPQKNCQDMFICITFDPILILLFVLDQPNNKMTLRFHLCIFRNCFETFEICSVWGS